MRRMRMKLLCAGFLLALMMPAVGAAQIQNGDFEEGGLYWWDTIPQGWSLTYPGSGGNPGVHARIASNPDKSVGIAHLYQGLFCGQPGGNTICVISFDYRMLPLAVDDPNTGLAFLMIDDEIVWSAAGPTRGGDFVHVTAAVPCGEHKFFIGLEVRQSANGDESEEWAVLFDNVAAMCEPVLPVTTSTWGQIKALYR